MPREIFVSGRYSECNNRIYELYMIQLGILNKVWINHGCASLLVDSGTNDGRFLLAPL